MFKICKVFMNVKSDNVTCCFYMSSIIVSCPKLHMTYEEIRCHIWC